MSNRKQRKPLPYSPNSYTYPREQGSPSKASVLLQQDHAEYIQSLAARKDNFCTCLDLYKMCYENAIPQKCLIHNNFITLYCENEYKLLCVNCIYSTAIHKEHRVIPSNNSIANVARDNEENLMILEEELERMKHVTDEMRRNRKTLDDEFRLIMQQVQDQFRAIYMLVQQRHELTKTRIVDAFERAISTNETATQEISWWKELLAKTRTTLPKPSQSEESEVYKHLVLDLFLKEKIDQDKLTYIPSGQEIRSEFLRQVSDLREAVEQVVGKQDKAQPAKVNKFF